MFIRSDLYGTYWSCMSCGALVDISIDPDAGNPDRPAYTIGTDLAWSRRTMHPGHPSDDRLKE